MPPMMSNIAALFQNPEFFLADGTSDAWNICACPQTIYCPHNTGKTANTLAQGRHERAAITHATSQPHNDFPRREEVAVQVHGNPPVVANQPVAHPPESHSGTNLPYALIPTLSLRAVVDSSSTPAAEQRLPTAGRGDVLQRRSLSSFHGGRRMVVRGDNDSGSHALPSPLVADGREKVGVGLAAAVKVAHSLNADRSLMARPLAAARNSVDGAAN
ncbi:glucose-6-phosphate dehydrogenase 3 [Striga asiatica]|uniref:Glucose-6-phosphate dehydrogenase 3 n=1 Tax=Striga asiatica TaxID=4170 RepID=A0A5A7PUM7_STRAF|nr:glucose-6-phosphate dehydrogenase 3 [Striga asiatica]